MQQVLSEGEVEEQEGLAGWRGLRKRWRWLPR
jgi:hypothetical protein